MNLAPSKNKDITFNSNLTSIDDNTSINFTKKSNEDINSFIPMLQEAIFDQIL